MLRHRIALFVVAIHLYCVPPGLARELDLGGFQRVVTRGLALFEVPGAAVTVVKDGRVVLAAGYGLRELGQPETVDANTLFGIASCTKAFTTAALAILVTEGKLHWDDPVIDHLPGFRLEDPYRTRELTIRDLVSHRSGYRSGSGNLLWLRSGLTRDAILERLRYLPAVYGFRARYGYSNVMLIAAGEVVAAVSGQSWDDFVEQRLFSPLGMRSSNTSIRDRASPGGNWATPHLPVGGKLQPIVPENVDNLGGAGAINASVNDLSRWLLLQLGRGQLEGRRFYSETAAEEMWIPQTITPIGTAPTQLKALTPMFSAYGLGWRLRDYRGRKLAFHSGGLAGLGSMAMLVPEEKLGIFIVTNQETSLQTALTYYLLDVFLDAPETDWVSAYDEVRAASRRRRARAAKRFESSRLPDAPPTFSLPDYEGTYRDALVGEAVVSESNGELRLRFTESPTYDARLDHWHYDTFVARFEHHSIADAFVTFVLGADGALHRMRMVPFIASRGGTYDYVNLQFSRSESAP